MKVWVVQGRYAETHAAVYDNEAAAQKHVDGLLWGAGIVWEEEVLSVYPYDEEGT